jgi:hypothetical protein
MRRYTTRTFALALAFAATNAVACKREPAPSESKDAGASASAITSPFGALPPPVGLDANPRDNERPLDPAIAAPVNAVATDPLASEAFRYLLDGMDSESVGELLAKPLKAANDATLRCAYAHARDAREAAALHDAVVTRCLIDLMALLKPELDARKIDPRAIESCAAAGP